MPKIDQEWQDKINLIRIRMYKEIDEVLKKTEYRVLQLIKEKERGP